MGARRCRLSGAVHTAVDRVPNPVWRQARRVATSRRAAKAKAERSCSLISCTSWMMCGSAPGTVPEPLYRLHGSHSADSGKIRRPTKKSGKI